MRKQQAGACRPLTDAEVGQLRVFLARRPRELALMEVMLSSARCGEALSLKVGDVWDGAKVIGLQPDGCACVRMHGAKGDFGTLILLPRAVEAIRAWMDRLVLCPDAPLFPSEQTGEALSYPRAAAIFADAFLRCGITGQVGTHSFRHSWAMRCSEAGMNHLWIMNAGRWRNIQSVVSYVTHSPQKMAKDLAQIEAEHGVAGS